MAMANIPSFKLPQFAYDFGSGDTEPGAHWLPGIAAETVIGIILYHLIFFQLLKRLLLSWHSSRPYWSYLLTYKGLFHSNVQIEIVYVQLLAIHHLIGGSMMLYGWYVGDAAWFAQGALFDLFDAVHDTFAMCVPSWPFEDRNKKLMTLMIPHHAFSFLICWPVIMSGLHQDPNCQLVGVSLLFAGGVSCSSLGYARTLRRYSHTEAIQEAVVNVFNLSVYLFCRFYVYPLAMYQLISDVWTDLSGAFRVMMIIVNICMLFFNVLIAVDATSMTARSIRNAFKGGKKTTVPRTGADKERKILHHKVEDKLG